MASTLQPPRKHRREIEAICVFVGKDQRLAGVVISHHGASPIEGGRPRITRATARSGEDGHIEGHPAAGALGAVDKADFRPTVRAQTAGLPCLTTALYA